jgi:acyl carrier protein
MNAPMPSKSLSSPSFDSLEARVHEHIVREYYIPDPSKLMRDTSLLYSGIIDSTGYMDLFTWIRDTFGIEVSGAEMEPSNFETVARIAGYLRGKLGGDEKAT